MPRYCTSRYSGIPGFQCGGFIMDFLCAFSKLFNCISDVWYVYSPTVNMASTWVRFSTQLYCSRLVCLSLSTITSGILSEEKWRSESRKPAWQVKSRISTPNMFTNFTTQFTNKSVKCIIVSKKTWRFVKQYYPTLILWRIRFFFKYWLFCKTANDESAWECILQLTYSCVKDFNVHYYSRSSSKSKNTENSCFSPGLQPPPPVLTS
jgi:hypothetical protein